MEEEYIVSVVNKVYVMGPKCCGKTTLINDKLKPWLIEQGINAVITESNREQWKTDYYMIISMGKPDMDPFGVLPGFRFISKEHQDVNASVSLNKPFSFRTFYPNKGIVYINSFGSNS